MYEYLNFKKYDMIDGNFTISSSPKVLIWDNFQLKNIGGPMGYCYNIHEFLKKHPNNIRLLFFLIILKIKLR